MRSVVRFFLGTVCLVLVLAVLGCGSAGSAADPEPPAPVKQPFEAPAFDAAVFEHDEPRFSVHYPADFVPQEDPNSVFVAASPMMVPRIDVDVDADEGEATLDELADGITQSFSELGGGEATVQSATEVTLRDGVTGSSEFVVDWSFQGFPLTSVVLLTPVAGQRVNVTVTGMEGADLEELRDIAYTLYFE